MVEFGDVVAGKVTVHNIDACEPRMLLLGIIPVQKCMEQNFHTSALILSS